MLFSGIDRPRAIIDVMKQSDSFPNMAFAVVVKPAYDKNFQLLFDEIQKEFVEEKMKINV